jgi:hypothetical protein
MSTAPATHRRASYGERYDQRLKWTALVCILAGVLSSLTRSHVALADVVVAFIIWAVIGVVVNLLVAVPPGRVRVDPAP